MAGDSSTAGRNGRCSTPSVRSRTSGFSRWRAVPAGSPSCSSNVAPTSSDFDAVMAMRFFHLADTPAAFLSEMRRVSKDQVFFDTFNRFSSRSIYNWLLPMGSRLYSRREVISLLEKADLELSGVEHDFVLPYGFYRKIPDGLARSFRRLDVTIGELPGGQRSASVSYWNTGVRED